jgi:hypothetical protein
MGEKNIKTALDLLRIREAGSLLVPVIQILPTSFFLSFFSKSI